MKGKTCTAVFVGEGSLLTQCAERWINRGQAVVAVVSSDEGIGRWADERTIQTSRFDENLVARLSELAPDYLFSVANLRILPVEALDAARVMAINFHDGPLPEIAGVNVPTWAIAEGRARHGITWHEMTSVIDGGGILVERRFDVPPGATSFQLNALCWEQGKDAFAELAERIAAGDVPTPGPATPPRAYHAAAARPSPACTLDFARSAEELERLARALDWGPSANPVGLPRLPISGDDVIVRSVRSTGTPRRAEPGTIVALDGSLLRVAAADFEVELEGFSRHGVEKNDLAALGLAVGQLLALDDARRYGSGYERAARHEAAWVAALAAATEPELVLGAPSQQAGSGVVDNPMKASERKYALAFLVLLRRLASADTVSVVVEESAFDAEIAGLAHLARSRPLTVEIAPDATARALQGQLDAGLARLRQRFTYARDVFARYPALRGRHLPSIAIRFGDGPIDESHALGLQLLSSGGYRVHHRLDRFSARDAQRIGTLLELLVAGIAGEPDCPVGDLLLLTESDARIVAASNAVEKGLGTEMTLPALFAAQVAQTPDRIAVRAGDHSLTFAELDRRSSQLAHLLRRKAVGPDGVVGVFVERNAAMFVSLLAIHKAGGAHLPLDPLYPRARIEHMIEDSGVRCIVATRKLQGELPFDGDVVLVDDEASYASEPAEAPAVVLAPDNLAYVIYTSGSTGLPKGVLVEHRQLTNFFAGMDRVIDRGTPGEEAWLAVTSLSFDISMLELFWTLCRGIPVVLHTPMPTKARKRHLELGLFYFASDASASAASYNLLLDGARFADQNGFSSVWTPERHFHAFGGLYPNAAVTLSALSQITSRVRLCAGSLVSPLHASPRIAEDFALVDNLSGGRVGVSFASGWQPNDFVFAPDQYERRKEQMIEQVDAVRRLWAGDSITMMNGSGKPTEVRTLPRPVQANIPVWLTAAGSPETFKAAGRMGCGLLTHLLGQTLEELGKKIEIYRRAWRDAGNEGEGRVTLMLHTFIGEDADAVKRTVREPMKRYLGSALDLVQKAAWTFPTFKEMTTSDGGKFQMDHLPEEDVNAILDYAFERYYATSGLFGTQERALGILERIEELGVDEVACLIDFGVPAEEVLASLPALAKVRAAIDARFAPREAHTGELLRTHAITHLQCTPSLAGMLLEDPVAREGLGRLRHWLVGGEPLPEPLAQRMRATGVGRITNVYGPTETTVWSTASTLDDGPITIGKPLANQAVHVLDERRRPLPPGIPGELYISGAGVARGYHRRPELTAERFVTIEHDGTTKRAYRTGDRVVLRDDGRLDYLGRVDHQVKIRGHRIELGEIEAVLARCPGVSRAVVDVRDGGNLVAWVERSPGAEAPGVDALRDACRADLPDVMIPARVVVLEALPQTPNGKIDRRALPEVAAEAVAVAPQERPAGELEETIAQAWKELLGHATIGRSQNFFDLGGHSLLAVQLAQRLGEALGKPVALMDVFSAPTIEKLAAKLGNGDGTTSAALQSSSARAEARRAMLQRRRA